MKIFLVEDSPGIRTKMKLLICKLDGMEVCGEADNEQDAVVDIGQTKPDCVVLDLALAQGTGIGVLKKIKALIPGLRVIVITNHTEKSYRDKCMQLGASNFLDKNREFDSLQNLLLNH